METESLSVMELLEVLEDLLDNAKTAPFSSKVLVDRDAMYEVLKDIRLFLPNEIKKSKWVMDERNKILVNAQEEADNIRQEAEKEREIKLSRLLDEHELTKYARDEAEKIMDEARVMSKELRLGAMQHVDGLLSDISKLFEDAYDEVRKQNSIIEQCYSEKIEELFENRRELREISK